MKKYKRKFGDRSDGRRVKGHDPLFRLIPHIMRTRMDSQVFFDETIDLDNIEEFVRAHRRDDLPTLSIMNVVVAALIRTVSQRPYINRFVAGNRVYARNYLKISMAVKKTMQISGAETTIIPEFELTDTLHDVCQKFNSKIDEIKNQAETDTDILATILAVLPDWLLRFVVFTIRNIDKIGLVPSAIRNASPFHSTAFVTDVGSIGIEPIYHHLYEFGTCSVFVAMGKKEQVTVLDKDKTARNKKVMRIKFVLDERICDGYYYAGTIKVFKRILKHPETLLVPPENVIEDDLL